MKYLLIALILLAPLPALASGFYLPWWAEWLMFLFTPTGLVAVLVVVVVIAIICKATQ